jgi:hypothetical protein
VRARVMSFVCLNYIYIFIFLINIFYKINIYLIIFNIYNIYVG